MNESLFNSVCNDYSYPDNATLREEYVKCGKVECKCFHGDKVHGPYLYAYWKENGRLRKRYLGKDLEHHNWRLEKITMVKDIGKSDSMRSEIEFYKRGNFLHNEVEKGNKIAKDYWDKFSKQKVTLDWAYRRVKEELRDWRMLNIMHIAEEQYSIKLHSAEDYRNFIVKLMEDKNLNTVDELDNYIRTEFR